MLSEARQSGNFSLRKDEKFLEGGKEESTEADNSGKFFIWLASIIVSGFLALAVNASGSDVGADGIDLDVEGDWDDGGRLREKIADSHEEQNNDQIDTKKERRWSDQSSIC